MAQKKKRDEGKKKIVKKSSYIHGLKTLQIIHTGFFKLLHEICLKFS